MRFLVVNTLITSQLLSPQQKEKHELIISKTKDRIEQLLQLFKEGIAWLYCVWRLIFFTELSKGSDGTPLVDTALPYVDLM